MHTLVAQFSRVKTAAFALLAVALFSLQAVAAHADTVLTIPGGADGSTFTAALAPFVTIAGVAVLAVLGLKFSPLMVGYIFRWVKMGLSRR